MPVTAPRYSPPMSVAARIAVLSAARTLVQQVVLALQADEDRYAGQGGVGPAPVGLWVGPGPHSLGAWRWIRPDGRAAWEFIPHRLDTTTGVGRPAMRVQRVVRDVDVDIWSLDGTPEVWDMTPPGEHWTTQLTTLTRRLRRESDRSQPPGSDHIAS